MVDFDWAKCLTNVIFRAINAIFTRFLGNPYNDRDTDGRTIFKAAGSLLSRIPYSRKISVTPSKQLVNQRDLALAYSPGVAAPCLEIERDPSTAALYTARGNLVAVVSNGTAVLGLGNIARWRLNRSWKVKAYCSKICGC